MQQTAVLQHWQSHAITSLNRTHTLVLASEGSTKTPHTPISEPNQYAIDHNATHISLCIGSWTQALVLHWLPINQYQRSFIPCYKCTSRDANCLVLFCFGIDLAHSNCLVWIQCVHIRFICNKLEFCWWFHTNRSTHTQLFFWFEQNKMFKCIQFLSYVHIHSTIENETEHENRKWNRKNRKSKTKLPTTLFMHFGILSIYFISIALVGHRK